MGAVVPAGDLRRRGLRASPPATHLREHPDRPAPTRREYESWRTRRREERPQTRCC
ncbi:CstA-like transporter-associated (seleno)protein [Embleya sp. NPDC008237]|uniref:CstA-like transporter-associated (seleno)protein n=1 Tax=Embleya sp. NPDC008237 TaxID=3363978 RepID=UPI0036EC8061